ncbi:hypothetical protein TNCT_501 [Trichonephila clavata]|uniref:Uncharacterized protein n=1 Tax=Trichonephila clavata TaxID=2740835 RepID=A0A8X6FPJ1_TRICU|nr:hypothetical protein TNCT_501 [Trichonephila clavata]
MPNTVWASVLHLQIDPLVWFGEIPLTRTTIFKAPIHHSRLHLSATETSSTGCMKDVWCHSISTEFPSTLSLELQAGQRYRWHCVNEFHWDF